MHFGKTASWVVMSALLLNGTSSLHAAEESKKKDPAAEMAEWAKMNAPGPEHKKLEALAGEWDVVTTTYMPDGTSMQSKGRAKETLIFGGRFIESTFEGSMMGMPFTGKGLTGYDNMKKVYVQTWTDSMSTGIMMFEGKMDEAGKVLTMKGEGVGPDGKPAKFTGVTTIIDNNSHTFEMSGPGPDGKEMKCVSIKYTRVK